MLKDLHIRNYALIKDAEIEFQEGFTAITGETGAGKSILLGALGLLLGNRADKTALRNQELKCVVEGTFSIAAYELKPFFDEREIDYEEDCIIRREIAKSGKSRAFINDTPVLLNDLKMMGEQLIDVHAQNAGQLLQQEQFYYDIVDGYANCVPQRKEFQKQLAAFKSKKKELEKRKLDFQRSKEQESYNRFVLSELQEAQLKDGEQAALEEELELLANADLIRSQLDNALQAIQGGSSSAVDLLQTGEQALSKLSGINTHYKELAERLNSAFIELDDISQELQQQKTSLQADPYRLSEVDERLGQINALLKKHGLLDEASLLKKKKELEEKVQELSEGEDGIHALEEELKKEEEVLKNLGVTLGKKRKKVLAQLRDEVLKDLQSMKMGNARFEVVLEEGALNAYGTSELVFVFNANKGGALQDLLKVASGGELSRVMLSLKRILSQKKALPTILFDEIDTGVSGDVADRMAEIMLEMSGNMQVMTITHLPQVAAKAWVQLKVSKDYDEQETYSSVEKLSSEERINAIAEMLSGQNVSDAALSNARELLGV